MGDSDKSMSGSEADVIRRDIRELRETVVGYREEVTDYHGEVREQIVTCKPCREMVAEHNRTLNGSNGEVGLKAHVQNSRRWWKWLWAFVGSLAAAVLALGVHAVKSMIGRG